MPQMLNYLRNYELDWGIIAVYTCENECDVKGKYLREFCYKQDVQKGDDENILEGLSEEKFEKMEIDEKIEEKSSIVEEKSIKVEESLMKAEKEFGKVKQKKSENLKVKKGSKNVEKAFEESEIWD